MAFFNSWEELVKAIRAKDKNSVLSDLTDEEVYIKFKQRNPAEERMLLRGDKTEMYDPKGVSRVGQPGTFTPEGDDWLRKFEEFGDPIQGVFKDPMQSLHPKDLYHRGRALSRHALLGAQKQVTGSSLGQVAWDLGEDLEQNLNPSMTTGAGAWERAAELQEGGFERDRRVVQTPALSWAERNAERTAAFESIHNYGLLRAPSKDPRYAHHYTNEGTRVIGELAGGVVADTPYYIGSNVALKGAAKALGYTGGFGGAIGAERAAPLWNANRSSLVAQNAYNAGKKEVYRIFGPERMSQIRKAIGEEAFINLIQDFGAMKLLYGEIDLSDPQQLADLGISTVLGNVLPHGMAKARGASDVGKAFGEIARREPVTQRVDMWDPEGKGNFVDLTEGQPIGPRYRDVAVDIDLPKTDLGGEKSSRHLNVERQTFDTFREQLPYTGEDPAEATRAMMALKMRESGFGPGKEAFETSLERQPYQTLSTEGGGGSLGRFRPETVSNPQQVLLYKDAYVPSNWKNEWGSINSKDAKPPDTWEWNKKTKKWESTVGKSLANDLSDDLSMQQRYIMSGGPEEMTTPVRGRSDLDVENKPKPGLATMVHENTHKWETDMENWAKDPDAPPEVKRIAKELAEMREQAGKLNAVLDLKGPRWSAYQRTLKKMYDVVMRVHKKGSVRGAVNRRITAEAKKTGKTPKHFSDKDLNDLYNIVSSDDFFNLFSSTDRSTIVQATEALRSKLGINNMPISMQLHENTLTRELVTRYTEEVLRDPSKIKDPDLRELFEVIGNVSGARGNKNFKLEALTPEAREVLDEVHRLVITERFGENTKQFSKLDVSAMPGEKEPPIAPPLEKGKDRWSGKIADFMSKHKEEGQARAAKAREEQRVETYPEEEPMTAAEARMVDVQKEKAGTGVEVVGTPKESALTQEELAWIKEAEESGELSKRDVEYQEWMERQAKMEKTDDTEFFDDPDVVKPVEEKKTRAFKFDGVIYVNKGDRWFTYSPGTKKLTPINQKALPKQVEAKFVGGTGGEKKATKTGKFFGEAPKKAGADAYVPAPEDPTGGRRTSKLRPSDTVEGTYSVWQANGAKIIIGKRDSDGLWVYYSKKHDDWLVYKNQEQAEKVFNESKKVKDKKLRREKFMVPFEWVYGHAPGKDPRWTELGARTTEAPEGKETGKLRDEAVPEVIGTLPSSFTNLDTGVKQRITVPNRRPVRTTAIQRASAEHEPAHTPYSSSGRGPEKYGGIELGQRKDPVLTEHWKATREDIAETDKILTAWQSGVRGLVESTVGANTKYVPVSKGQSVAGKDVYIYKTTAETEQAGVSEKIKRGEKPPEEKPEYFLDERKAASVGEGKDRLQYSEDLKTEQEIEDDLGRYEGLSEEELDLLALEGRSEEDIIKLDNERRKANYEKKRKEKSTIDQARIEELKDVERDNWAASRGEFPDRIDKPLEYEPEYITGGWYKQVYDSAGKLLSEERVEFSDPVFWKLRDAALADAKARKRNLKKSSMMLKRKAAGEVAPGQTEIRVINKHKTDPAKVDGTVISIMRKDSPLGNPYSHKSGTSAKFKVDTVEEAVAKYKEWLLGRIKAGDQKVIAELDRISKAKDPVLVCVDAPGPCHGDVIKEVIEDGLFKQTSEQADVTLGTPAKSKEPKFNLPETTGEPRYAEAKGLPVGEPETLPGGAKKHVGDVVSILPEHGPLQPGAERKLLVTKGPKIETRGEKSVSLNADVREVRRRSQQRMQVELDNQRKIWTMTKPISEDSWRKLKASISKKLPLKRTSKGFEIDIDKLRETGNPLLSRKTPEFWAEGRMLAAKQEAAKMQVDSPLLVKSAKVPSSFVSKRVGKDVYIETPDSLVHKYVYIESKDLDLDNLDAETEVLFTGRHGRFWDSTEQRWISGEEEMEVLRNILGDKKFNELTSSVKPGEEYVPIISGGDGYGRTKTKVSLSTIDENALKTDDPETEWIRKLDEDIEKMDMDEDDIGLYLHEQSIKEHGEGFQRRYIRQELERYDEDFEYNFSKPNKVLGSEMIGDLVEFAEDILRTTNNKWNSMGRTGKRIANNAEAHTVFVQKWTNTALWELRHIKPDDQNRISADPYNPDMLTEEMDNVIKDVIEGFTKDVSELSNKLKYQLDRARKFEKIYRNRGDLEKAEAFARTAEKEEIRIAKFEEAVKQAVYHQALLEWIGDELVANGVWMKRKGKLIPFMKRKNYLPYMHVNEIRFIEERSTMGKKNLTSRAEGARRPDRLSYYLLRDYYMWAFEKLGEAKYWGLTGHPEDYPKLRMAIAQSAKAENLSARETEWLLESVDFALGKTDSRVSGLERRMWQWGIIPFAQKWFRIGDWRPLEKMQPGRPTEFSQNMLRVWRAFGVFTKMVFSPIQNFWQWRLAMQRYGGDYGYFKSLKLLGETMNVFTKAGKLNREKLVEFANKSGAVYEGQVKEILGLMDAETGIHSFDEAMVKGANLAATMLLRANQFNRLEKGLLRVFAANLGKETVLHNLGQLRDPSLSARKRRFYLDTLRDLKVDEEVIAGKRDITTDELYDVGWRASHRTNFGSKPYEVPFQWGRTETGKTLSHLMGYAIKSIENDVGHVFHRAAIGDFKPFAGFMLMTGIMGELTRYVYSEIIYPNNKDLRKIEDEKRRALAAIVMAYNGELSWEEATTYASKKLFKRQMQNIFWSGGLAIASTFAMETLLNWEDMAKYEKGIPQQYRTTKLGAATSRIGGPSRVELEALFRLGDTWDIMEKAQEKAGVQLLPRETDAEKRVDRRRFYYTASNISKVWKSYQSWNKWMTKDTPEKPTNFQLSKARVKAELEKEKRDKLLLK